MEGLGTQNVGMFSPPPRDCHSGSALGQLPLILVRFVSGMRYTPTLPIYHQGCLHLPKGALKTASAGAGEEVTDVTGDYWLLPGTP